VHDLRPNAAGNYEAYWPTADLRPFLHRVVHGWGEDDSTVRLKIPPTGGLFISYVAGAPLRVHFSDRVYDERPRYFIGGQLRREQPMLESLGRFRLFGAELTPTGFYRLFRHRADGFTDDIVGFAALFPEDAAWLDANLSPDAPAETTVRKIETVLRRLADTALEVPKIERVVQHIVAARGLVNVAELSRRYDMSERRLHREFQRITGIPPKHYAKIVQINAVIGALQAGDHDRLITLAMDHGYFDQSHFIHDFKRFVGDNPRTFLRSGSQFLRTFLGAASH